MIIWYFVAFFGGVLVGLFMMALMTAAKLNSMREVHVYYDKTETITEIRVPDDCIVIPHRTEG